ncbi:hypothetical protein ANCCAN_14965 [Ancylostoma caninum]|uniref:Uncharacterized protein n=1 Tax=Ancylostoma caninum TaxID=29170 RepID=A0A368G7Z4_ANCCA|nr:hypothetical protein ANCCAN_14965 [Ancylostoma caninum]
MDKKDPPVYFPKPEQHMEKTMLSVWCCAAGVIHYSFAKPGQSITSESYGHDISSGQVEIPGYGCSSIPGRWINSGAKKNEAGFVLAANKWCWTRDTCAKALARIKRSSNEAGFVLAADK